MVQWLRVLAALTEDQASTPSTHMAIYSHLELQAQRIQHPHLASVDTAWMWYTDTQEGKKHIHIKINK